MIAMSGGVDSSVAAYLCRQEAASCAGAIMKLLPETEKADPLNITDAKKVADKIGMPFYTFDCVSQFDESVIRTFADTYKKGETPNPCVECNRLIKFDLFGKMAGEIGYNRVATGHYAKIEFNNETGRYHLKKATDLTKDQSYFLYTLSQEQLKNTILPLGDMTKADVRKIADKQNFDNAGKKESQDICFVPDGDYGSFIEEYIKEKSPEGDFVDMESNVLGTHKGIIRYTIGQRKGLGLALPEPMFVCNKDVENNQVVLCRYDDLFSDTLTAKNINLISTDSISEPLDIKAKIRYNQTEQPATVIQTDDDELRIIFKEPQKAVAKGQSVVIYDEDTVVGGGIIDS